MAEDDQNEEGSSGEEGEQGGQSAPKQGGNSGLKKGIMIGGLFLMFILMIALLATIRFDPGDQPPNSPASSSNDSSLVTFPTGLDDIDAASLCLQGYIKEKSPNSPFIKDVTDVGKVFVNAGKLKDVNPALMVAIAGAETSFATNGWAKNHPETHNYYGLTATESQEHIVITNNGVSVKVRKFSSWEEAIEYQAEYLRENYINEGKTTIILIGAKYAPVGADNDPTGLNNQWIINVSKFMSEIGTKCPVFSPSIAPTDLAKKIIKTARKEAGLDEYGGKYDPPKNGYAPANGNCTRYISGGTTTWRECYAAFASWVYTESGVNIGAIKTIEDLKNYFVTKDESAYQNNITADKIKPGDILMLRNMGDSTSSNISNLVGIVTKVNGNTIDTIIVDKPVGYVNKKSFTIDKVLGVLKLSKISGQ